MIPRAGTDAAQDPATVSGTRHGRVDLWDGGSPRAALFLISYIHGRSVSDFSRRFTYRSIVMSSVQIERMDCVCVYHTTRPRGK